MLLWLWFFSSFSISSFMALLLFIFFYNSCFAFMLFIHKVYKYKIQRLIKAMFLPLTSANISAVPFGLAEIQKARGVKKCLG